MKLKEYECSGCGRMNLARENLSGKLWAFCPNCNAKKEHYSKAKKEEKEA